MEENKSMCSFVRYESGVEGGMVRISEMRAFSNHPYHVEKDAAVKELSDLIKKKQALQKEELISAMAASSRSYEEIMDFLKGKE